jgi:hypothetical protein
MLYRQRCIDQTCHAFQTCLSQIACLLFVFIVILLTAYPYRSEQDLALLVL